MAKRTRRQTERQDPLKDRIEWAIRQRDTDRGLEQGSYWSGDKDYRNLCYYLGYQYPDWYNVAEGGADRVCSNVIRTNLDIRNASLLSMPWMVAASPRQQKFDPRARIVPRVAKYEWTANEVDFEHEHQLIDKGVFGRGVIQVGWRYREVTSDARIAKQEARYGLPPGDFQLRKDIDGNSEIWHVSRNTISGEVEERKLTNGDASLAKVTIHDDIFVEHVPALNVFFDPAETDIRTLKNSRYIVWREYLSPDEIEDNPDFDQDVELESERVPNYLYGSAADAAPAGYGNKVFVLPLDGGGPGGETEPLVCVWNYLGQDPKDPDKWIWEQRANVPGGGTLKTTEWVPQVFPFVVDAEAPEPGMVYPQSILDQSIADQDEINDCITELHNHRKRFRTAIFTRKEMFEDKDLTNLASLEDGEIIGLSVTGQADLRNLFWTIPTPQLQPEVYSSAAHAENRIRIRMGVTEYQQGVHPEGKKTATATLTLTQQSGARLQRDVESTRRARTRTLTLMLDTIVANADPQMPRRYAFLSPEGQKVWEDYSITEIFGDFDLDVQVINNNEQEISKLQLLLAVLTPYSEAGKNQQGQMLMTDPDFPGENRPIVKNTKPFLERLLIMTGYQDYIDTVLGEKPDGLPTGASTTQGQAPPEQQVPPAPGASGGLDMASLLGGMNGG